MLRFFLCKQNETPFLYWRKMQSEEYRIKAYNMEIPVRYHTFYRYRGVKDRLLWIEADLVKRLYLQDYYWDLDI